MLVLRHRLAASPFGRRTTVNIKDGASAAGAKVKTSSMRATTKLSGRSITIRRAMQMTPERCSTWAKARALR
jgi:hypothetical protein